MASMKSGIAILLLCSWLCEGTAEDIVEGKNISSIRLLVQNQIGFLTSPSICSCVAPLFLERRKGLLPRSRVVLPVHRRLPGRQVLPERQVSTGEISKILQFFCSCSLFCSCCRFECHYGKWICKEKCPPCSRLGGPGRKFCPVDGSPCSCQGSFTDASCCGLRRFSTFTCVDGRWKCSGSCPKPICSAIGGPGKYFCPKDFTSCNCVGGFTDTYCCKKNGMSTFNCVNGRWSCNSRLCYKSPSPDLPGPLPKREDAEP